MSLPDFTPRMMELQARVQQLEHLVHVNRLAFETILAHQDQAGALANGALKRIERAG